MIEFLKQNYETLAVFGVVVIVCSVAAWAIIYYVFYAVRSQILGKTVWCGNALDNSVALTFDDGPSPDTLEILDFLRDENIKATFFLIGREVEKYPEIVKRIAADKHEIGNHSYSHPIFLFCSPGKTRRELEKNAGNYQKRRRFRAEISASAVRRANSGMFYSGEKVKSTNRSMERRGV